jgi:DNA polymerase III psi subunit
MGSGYRKCPRCGVRLADESKLNDKYVTAGVVMIFLLVAALIVMLLSSYFMFKIKDENRELQAKQAKHAEAISELQEKLEQKKQLYYQELLHDINYIVTSHNSATNLEYELKNLRQCNRLLIAHNKSCKLVRMIEKYIMLTALLNADKNLKSVKLSEKDYQVLSPEFVEKCTQCRNGIKLCSFCKGIATCPECQELKKCTACTASGFIVHTQRAERAWQRTQRRIRDFVASEVDKTSQQ